MNKAIISGNLGADVELRSLKDGTKVATLRVATSYKPKDGEQKTTWHTVTVFKKSAENAAKYLKKGSRVIVEGHIDNDEYEKDGVKKFSSKIIAENIEFQDRPEKKGGKEEEKDEGGES